MATNFVLTKPKRRESVSDRIMNTLFMLVVIISLFLCLAPFIYIIAESFSSTRAVNSRQVFLWPVDPSLVSYRKVFRDTTIITAFENSVFVTVVHTLLAMALSILCAYPLTKRRLKGRKFFSLMIVFTMLFSGGMIPDYLLAKSLHLTNNLWGLIIPCGINTFNMIILRTFFATSIPVGIEEAAMVDGSNDLRTLVRIVLPLSTPVLATVALFYAVARWNGFQDAKFYISEVNLYTMPQKLNVIVNSSQLSSVMNLQADVTREQTSAAGIQAASIIVTTLPILIVYPWLQKYFVHGVMVGGVKE